LSVPYGAAPRASLAVPTALTSAAITPRLLHKFVTPTTLPVVPKPNITLSSLNLEAADYLLAVPTPATSDATTPELFTKFFNDTTEPVVP